MLLWLASPLPQAQLTSPGNDQPSLTPEKQSAIDEASKASYPAGVLKGTPLVWRLLDQEAPTSDSTIWFNQIHVGKFSAGPDQQILFMPQDDYVVVKADGSWRKLSFPDYVSPDGFSHEPEIFDVWDYDGDGIDDLLVTAFDRLDADVTDKGGDHSQLNDHMAVYSLSGKLLGSIAGVPMGPYIVHGDLDGDGKPDLFMDEAGTYGVDPLKKTCGFGTGGKVLFTADPDWTMATVSGDLDGDGRDEIVREAGGGLEAIGIGQAQTPIPGLSAAEVKSNWSPQACLDLDGDHRGELLSWHGEVVNLTTQQRFVLEPPPGYSRFVAFGAGQNDYELATVNGQRCIVALVGHDVLLPETLAIWSTDGKLIYAENLGEIAQQLEVLHAGGKDHIVVLTRTRLLIAPGMDLPAKTVAQPQPTAAALAAEAKQADATQQQLHDELFPRLPDAPLIKPRTRVMVGRAKPWRTLWAAAKGADFSLGPLLVGHLVAGPDQDLCVMDYPQDQLREYSADGKFTVLPQPVRPVPSTAPGGNVTSMSSLSGRTMQVNCLWDYDGDGIDDLVCCDHEYVSAAGHTGQLAPGVPHSNLLYDRSESRATTYVFNAQGKLLGTLAGTIGTQTPMLCDLDGDGHSDLLLNAISEPGAVVPLRPGLRGFGLGGKVLLDLGPEWNVFYATGCLDGSHRTSVFCRTAAGEQSAGWGRQPVAVSLPKSHSGFELEPEWCQDLDGDGVDEVLDSDGWMHNLQTGRQFELQHPRGISNMGLDGQFGQNIVAFEADGKTMLAALVSADMLHHAGNAVWMTQDKRGLLAIWSATGTLRYCEEFNAAPLWLRRLHAGGIDHLVVQTDTHLLIWP